MGLSESICKIVLLLRIGSLGLSCFIFWELDAFGNRVLAAKLIVNSSLKNEIQDMEVLFDCFLPVVF